MLIYDPNSIFCLVDGGWANKRKLLLLLLAPGQTVRQQQETETRTLNEESAQVGGEKGNPIAAAMIGSRH